MNVNLLTDAPKHNLALMKISTFHKVQGDQVWLNGVGDFDLTYGSWLFDFSHKGVCQIEGGPGIDPAISLDLKFETCPPDYSLMNLDYSVGYTWKYCPRKCPFCIVPQQKNGKNHFSIWSFHDSRFKKICLLNNNTFSDPQWLETFKEIWAADLTVIDENGYDVRLLDDEKAEALKKTRFEKNSFAFAWDQIEDEFKILQGFEIAKKHKLLTHNTNVFILTGFNTTLEENIHRCQKVVDLGANPYIMIYNINNQRDRELRKFRRMVHLHYYRSYSSLKEAWRDYQSNKV